MRPFISSLCLVVSLIAGYMPAAADMSWVQGNGRLCSTVCGDAGRTAVVSGTYRPNGRPFFVCRAHWRNEGMRPGFNLSPSWGSHCHIPAAREQAIAEYQCLCASPGTDYKWWGPSVISGGCLRACSENSKGRMRPVASGIYIPNPRPPYPWTPPPFNICHGNAGDEGLRPGFILEGRDNLAAELSTTCRTPRVNEEGVPYFGCLCTERPPG